MQICTMVSITAILVALLLATSSVAAANDARNSHDGTDGSRLQAMCDSLKFVEGETSDVNCTLKDLPLAWMNQPTTMILCSSDTKIFEVSVVADGTASARNASSGQELVANFCFEARGRFVGFAELEMILLSSNSSIQEIGDKADQSPFFITTNNSLCNSFGTHTINDAVFENFHISSRQSLEVSVVRKERIIDTIFTTSLIILVMIAYVNMGCTLDLDVVKATLRRPKGPAVGLACQYIFMPLMAYCLGLLLLESPSLRLALLMVGCSPGGGASNIWTVLLDGNVNLSVTMTFVSSIAAFATMPLWIFTLGRTIAQDGDHLTIPYSNVALSAVSFVIPAAVGLLIAKKWPKAAKLLVKGLKPFGAFFLLYALTFGIYANVYAVKLLNWKVVVAPMILIWSGFACGAIVSRFLLKFPLEDVVAVALETGIQNTGVAFVVLKFSVGQPAADLSIVIIFMSSMMMPIPPLMTYAVMKCFRRSKRKSADGIRRLEESPSFPEQDKMTMVNPVANGGA